MLNDWAGATRQGLDHHGVGDGLFVDLLALAVSSTSFLISPLCPPLVFLEWEYLVLSSREINSHLSEIGVHKERTIIIVIRVFHCEKK